MDTLDCILSRRSVRAFENKKVSPVCIEKMIEHARFSPSWANTKTARYTCVTDDGVKAAIAQHCYSNNINIVLNAPHLMIVSAVAGRSGQGSINHTPKEWLMFDSGAAAQTFCLAAWEMGVATIIMGGFKPDISQLIDLPPDEELVALIPFGYPAETPKAPRRKEVGEILRTI